MPPMSDKVATKRGLTMPPEQEQVRVTLRAPASLVKALEHLALKEDRSLSAEIRRLMRRHVESCGQRGLLKEHAPM